MIRKKLFGDLPREVKVLTTAGFLVAVGFGILIPAIPLFAKSFGVNNASVGLLVSAFAMARFSSGLFAGKLVDLFGERNVFAVGILMVSFFSFLCALAQTFTQLLIFRTAGGLGSSMFSVAAGSIIMRSVSDDQRGRAQSVYNGSFLVGGISGPAIGGALIAISPRTPFFVYATALLIAGTFGFLFLKTGRSDSKESKQDDSSMGIREAIRLAPYRAALIISFVAAWVLFGLRVSILPIFVIDQLHANSTVVGIGFGIAALIQGIFLLPAGSLSDEKGRRIALLIGTSIVFIGVIALVFAIHPWMYLFAMGIMGLGGAFLSTTPANIVGDVIRGKSGQVIALWQMAGDAGMIVGPLTVGFLSDIFSFRTAFAVSAVVFSVGVILAYRLPETRKSHLPQSSD